MDGRRGVVNIWYRAARRERVKPSEDALAAHKAPWAGRSVINDAV